MVQERLAEIEQLLKVRRLSYRTCTSRRIFLIEQISTLNRERKNLLHAVVKESPAQLSSAPITNQSNEETKIALFRSLFRGREDVSRPRCLNRWLGLQRHAMS
jgi:hypothetical protein